MENMRNKRILLVDDDEHLLRALNKTLASEGALVTSAQWAGDAVEFLIQRDKHVDMVITDLRMPLVTGMTLVYALGLMFPAIPVVVLTAYGSPEVRAECFRQGAVAFLEKSLNTSQLLAEIEKVFTTRQSDSVPPLKSEVEFPADKNVLLDRIIHAHDRR